MKDERFVSNASLFSIDGQQYELSAVIIHVGNLGSGHYVTVAKREGKWYLLDDMRVTLLSSFEEVKRYCSRGYMFLYKQKEKVDGDEA